MAWSDDGEFWTAIEGGYGATDDGVNYFIPGESTFGGNIINAIAYGEVNGQGWFVAGGTNGRMAWSDNGQTWNAIRNTESTFGNNRINAIAYGEVNGQSRFVAVGERGRMAWSDDGETTWNEITAAQSTFPDHSTNGQIYAITYGEVNGQARFVAVGFQGRIVWSDDGQTWNSIFFNAFNSIDIIRGITYGEVKGQARFVAVGRNGRIAWSE